MNLIDYLSSNSLQAGAKKCLIIAGINYEELLLGALNFKFKKWLMNYKNYL